MSVLNQYGVALLAAALSAGVIVLAIAQRAVAAELDRRGLCRGALPAVRTAWLVLAGTLIAVGSLWSFHSAALVDLALLMPYVVPAALILVGLFLLYIYRPRRDARSAN